jgi:hypothetical protein
MDNQKTLQIVMIALLIISTTMGILTYIALMSFTGGVSFNPSSAFDFSSQLNNEPLKISDTDIGRISLVNTNGQTNNAISKDQCDKMCLQTFGCTDGPNDPDPNNNHLRNCIESICNNESVRSGLTGDRSTDGPIFREACKGSKAKKIQE